MSAYKKIIFIFFFYQAFAGSAQDTGGSEYHETPFNRESAANSWAIKAKILPWISPIGTGSGYNPSVGLEFGFAKNQSLGIDLFYNQYSFSTGDIYDSVNDRYTGGYREYTYDRALFLNYRYYFDAQKLRKKQGCVLYLGSFLRVGKISCAYDKAIIKETRVIHENNGALGVLFGILQEVRYFSGIRKALYLDAWFGVYVKQKHLVYESYPLDRVPEQHTDHPVNLGIRIGVTLSMAFKR